MPHQISELRQDLVSGDWVVIATGRAKRPHDFLGARHVREALPVDSCPFEELHTDAVFSSANQSEVSPENWSVQVIPNKYPAFDKAACATFNTRGPYQWTDGAGFHEVVITRSHTRSLAVLTNGEVEAVIAAYQERYRVFQKDECVQYVSIFHNHGSRAGATVTHPHSQMIAIPVIPPDVGRSMDGSARYFAERHTCIHCVMLAYEREVGERIIYENDICTVFAPYASHTAFEVRIFPKKHAAQFEEIDAGTRAGVADALRTALAKLFIGLEDPDYNFFIHTAPAKNPAALAHYHWHIEILPKTAIWAGFEMGTGIEISTIAPEMAAEFLRSVVVA
ncbi:MAG: DUF4921 family protein [bacterium]|nr:DUF4921 family protein [bacterium]MDZ4299702.1 DUF4921 family protein [Candidatus Sungbacteria bacterium]